MGPTSFGPAMWMWTAFRLSDSSRAKSHEKVPSAPSATSSRPCAATAADLLGGGTMLPASSAAVHTAAGASWPAGLAAGAGAGAAAAALTTVPRSAPSGSDCVCTMEKILQSGRWQEQQH